MLLSLLVLPRTDRCKSTPQCAPPGLRAKWRTPMLDSVPTKLCHFGHVTNSALISSATHFLFLFLWKAWFKRNSYSSISGDRGVLYQFGFTGKTWWKGTRLYLIHRITQVYSEKKMILPSHPYYASPFTHHPGVPHFAKRSLATPVFLRPTHAYIQRVFTQGEIIHLYNSCHLRGPLEYLRLWCSVV